MVFPISVNFWYDMEFDIKYVYYKFVERLKDTLNQFKTKDNDVRETTPNTCDNIGVIS